MQGMLGWAPEQTLQHIPAQGQGASVETPRHLPLPSAAVEGDKTPTLTPTQLSAW